MNLLQKATLATAPAAAAATVPWSLLCFRPWQLHCKATSAAGMITVVRCSTASLFMCCASRRFGWSFFVFVAVGAS